MYEKGLEKYGRLSARCLSVVLCVYMLPVHVFSVQEKDEQLARAWQILEKAADRGVSFVGRINRREERQQALSAPEALAEIPGEKAISLLTMLSESSSDAVRTPAILALIKRADRPSSFLSKELLQNKSNSAFARYKIVETLADVNEDSALELLKLALQDPDQHLRNVAFQSLVRKGSAALPVLAEALKSGDEYKKEFAAGALGQIGDRRAVPMLKSAVKDPSERVRFWVSFSLAKFGEVEAEEGLREASQQQEELLNRLRAAASLYRLGHESFGERLREALTSPDQSRRRAAIFAISNVRDRSMIPFLYEALESLDDTIRAEAVLALKAIATEGDIPILRRMLSDTSTFVRVNAAKILVELGVKTGDVRKTLAEVLKVDNFPQPEPAVGVLLEIAPDDNVLLRSALDHSNRWVRLEAVKALAERRPPDFLTLLREKMLDTSFAATSALVEKAGRDALPIFESFLSVTDEELDGSDAAVRKAIAQLYAASGIVRILQTSQ